MIEKQVNHSIALLDAFFSSIDIPNLTLQTYRKSSYIGLSLKFQGFYIVFIED